jgi:hypothetical protein
MKPKCPKLKGPLYKHLGHFAKDEYIQKGHNSNGEVEMKKVGSVTFMNFDKGMEVKKGYEDAERIRDRINLRKRISLEEGRPESMMPSPKRSVNYRMKLREEEEE